MKHAFPNAPLLLMTGLLSWSCNAELLVGENACQGDGVDCDSDAPTLEILDAILGGEGRTYGFDVEASRSVAPTWLYDDPASRLAQLSPAPGGGVWALYLSAETELLRVNAEGEPVELHSLDLAVGTLSSDEALRPVILSVRGGHVIRTTVGPPGEVVEWTVAQVEPGSWPLLVDGPDGRVRTARFEKRGSYVAEYLPVDELVWKQTDLRDARGFPFDEPVAGVLPNAAYRMIALSDGSIAVGVPKQARSDRRPGLSVPERVQGVTLIDPVGNVRWDMILDDASRTMFLSPGLDGGVVYANSPSEGSNLVASSGMMVVHVIERDGKRSVSWRGERTGFHDVMPLALCTDPAGTIYAVTLTGERNAPVLTVCRMNPGEPAAVECVGIEDVLPPSDYPRSTANVFAVTAPEPDSLVLSVTPTAISPDEQWIGRVLRIDL